MKKFVMTTNMFSSNAKQKSTQSVFIKNRQNANQKIYRGEFAEDKKLLKFEIN
jgi:hypothetical protein